MALNKQKGQMYPWVTHTWNPIRGNCPHQCSYCYMKIRGDLGVMRLVEKELELNLGSGKTIFIGSSCDMWADKIPFSWINRVLKHCKSFSKNKYIFQSKNPSQFKSFWYFLPTNSLWGTTLESDIHYDISKAPSVKERFRGILGLRCFISVEPILDFNSKIFLEWLKTINPEFVSIGADSQGHKLPEPPPDKIKELIAELQKFTEVKVKSNLKRLLK